MLMKMKRNRFNYLVYTILVMVMGLGSRKYQAQLPYIIGKYSGDVLWALMVFFMVGFLFKRESIMKVSIIALLFSFGIELSQLYHAPWIHWVRKTIIGGLVLGQGFLWSDLICYMFGILVGVVIELKMKIKNEIS
jgi:hypothetical protein